MKNHENNSKTQSFLCSESFLHANRNYFLTFIDEYHRIIDMKGVQKMAIKAMQSVTRVPTTYDSLISGLAVNEEKQSVVRPLYTWDYVQECTERCPAYEGTTCHFNKDVRTNKRCKVMDMYLKGVADTVMLAYPKDEIIDPRTLWRVGMHLMPLYQMLGRMKIEEATFHTVIFTDDKGRRKANPIYKEIRETLKQIESAWRDLNLGGSLGEGYLDFGDKSPSGRGANLTDPDDYYTRMQKGGRQVKT